MNDGDLMAHLSEPFHPDEIKFKPQVVSGNRAMCIAYVDARVVMDRLDDVFGIGGWQTAYQIVPDGVVCKLRVKVHGEWIEHHDVGSFSEQPDDGDKLKAAFSDSLKRAAVHLGIGIPATRFRHVPGFFGYAVSDDGSVHSKWEQSRWGKTTAGEWRRLKTPPDNHGYLQVNLSCFATKTKAHFKVHQLVMRTFVGPLPPGLCVRHLDGDKTNNRLSNLAYGTYKENAEDTVRHGRTNRGRRCPAAKLHDADVLAIRRRLAAGEMQKDLAAEFGVSGPTLSDIATRRTWGYLSDG